MANSFGYSDGYWNQLLQSYAQSQAFNDNSGSTTTYNPTELAAHDDPAYASLLSKYKAQYTPAKIQSWNASSNPLDALTKGAADAAGAVAQQSSSPALTGLQGATPAPASAPDQTPQLANPASPTSGVPTPAPPIRPPSPPATPAPASSPTPSPSTSPSGDAQTSSVGSQANWNSLSSSTPPPPGLDASALAGLQSAGKRTLGLLY